MQVASLQVAGLQVAGMAIVGMKDWIALVDIGGKKVLWKQEEWEEAAVACSAVGDTAAV